eukprot:gene4955-3555_t
MMERYRQTYGGANGNSDGASPTSFEWGRAKPRSPTGTTPSVELRTTVFYLFFLSSFFFCCCCCLKFLGCGRECCVMSLYSFRGWSAAFTDTKKEGGGPKSKPKVVQQTRNKINNNNNNPRPLETTPSAKDPFQVDLKGPPESRMPLTGPLPKIIIIIIGTHLHVDSSNAPSYAYFPLYLSFLGPSSTLTLKYNKCRKKR